MIYRLRERAGFVDFVTALPLAVRLPAAERPAGRAALAFAIPGRPATWEPEAGLAPARVAGAGRPALADDARVPAWSDRAVGARWASVKRIWVPKAKYVQISSTVIW